MKKMLRLAAHDFMRFLGNCAEAIVIVWTIVWALTIGGLAVVLGAYVESDSTLVYVLALIFSGAGWVVVFYFMTRAIRDYFKRLIERSKTEK